MADWAMFSRGDEAKQRLEHILEIELMESAGGLEAGWKMLRRGIENDQTFWIQQLDLCGYHY